MSYRISLSSPHSLGSELGYIREALMLQQLSMTGQALVQFESSIKLLTGASHLVLTNSGTSAIHLALKLCNTQPGDYVICPTFTYAASAFPIMYERAHPIFVDSEHTTWNMDPELLEQAIVSTNQQTNKSKKIAAIIAVHIYGMPCDIRSIVEVGRKYQIPVIEDAAEAIGSQFKGKHVGTFGDYGVLSFNGNKVITTAGGGAFLIKEFNEMVKGKKLASQAREDGFGYLHYEVGYNYQMDNISAAVGLGQLQNLDLRIERRREIFTRYAGKLQVSGSDFQNDPSDASSNRWLSCFLVGSEGIRNAIINELAAIGIEARPLWKPLHLQPVFTNSLRFGGEISTSLFESGVCLPSGFSLRNEDVDEIIAITNKVIEHGRHRKVIQ